MSWERFPLRRWNRLSLALGFLLLELAAMSAGEELGLARLLWITAATLSVFTLCYLLEDSLQRRGRKIVLWIFQGLFGIAFAAAVLLLLIKMISA